MPISLDSFWEQKTFHEFKSKLRLPSPTQKYKNLIVFADSLDDENNKNKSYDITVVETQQDTEENIHFTILKSSMSEDIHNYFSSFGAIPKPDDVLSKFRKTKEYVVPFKNLIIYNWIRSGTRDELPLTFVALKKLVNVKKNASQVNGNVNAPKKNSTHPLRHANGQDVYMEKNGKIYIPNNNTTTSSGGKSTQKLSSRQNKSRKQKTTSKRNTTSQISTKQKPKTTKK
jgi:hypothetical protein